MKRQWFFIIILETWKTFQVQNQWLYPRGKFDRFNCAINTFCAMLCLVAQLCLTLCNPVDCSPPGSSVHGDCPGKNGMGCHALLQGIFPTQGLNPGFLHCRWILYHLSHQGSPSNSCCCCCCVASVVSNSVWPHRRQPTRLRRRLI